MGGEGSGKKVGQRDGKKKIKGRRYVSTVALRNQLKDPRVLRDRLFAASNLKDELAKLSIAEAVAQLRYEKDFIIHKRSKGTATYDEEKRLLPILKEIGRNLERLGLVGNDKSNDEDVDVSYSDEGEITR